VVIELTDATLSIPCSVEGSRFEFRGIVAYLLVKVWTIVEVEVNVCEIVRVVDVG
jgi:hypothetical protein